MASAPLLLAEAAVARLRASPTPGGIAVANIRRSHRTVVTREKSPALQVQVPSLRRVGGKGCIRWDAVLRVRIVIRDDTALDGLDPLLEQVLARIDPATTGLTAYPTGVDVELQRVEIDEQIADEDLLVCILDFAASLFTAENSLEVLE